MYNIIHNTVILILVVFIAICADWISEKKEGHGKSGFYLNRKLVIGKSRYFEYIYILFYF